MDAKFNLEAFLPPELLIEATEEFRRNLREELGLEFGSLYGRYISGKMTKAEYERLLDAAIAASKKTGFSMVEFATKIEAYTENLRSQGFDPNYIRSVQFAADIIKAGERLRAWKYGDIRDLLAFGSQVSIKAFGKAPEEGLTSVLGKLTKAEGYFGFVTTLATDENLTAANFRRQVVHGIQAAMQNLGLKRNFSPNYVANMIDAVRGRDFFYLPLVQREGGNIELLPKNLLSKYSPHLETVKGQVKISGAEAGEILHVYRQLVGDIESYDTLERIEKLRQNYSLKLTTKLGKWFLDTLERAHLQSRALFDEDLNQQYSKEELEQKGEALKMFYEMVRGTSYKNPLPFDFVQAAFRGIKQFATDLGARYHISDDIGRDTSRTIDAEKAKKVYPYVVVPKGMSVGEARARLRAVYPGQTSSGASGNKKGKKTYPNTPEGRFEKSFDEFVEGETASYDKLIEQLNKGSYDLYYDLGGTPFYSDLEPKTFYGYKAVAAAMAHEIYQSTGNQLFLREDYIERISNILSRNVNATELDALDKQFIDQFFSSEYGRRFRGASRGYYDPKAPITYAQKLDDLLTATRAMFDEYPGFERLETITTREEEGEIILDENQLTTFTTEVMTQWDKGVKLEFVEWLPDGNALYKVVETIDAEPLFYPGEKPRAEEPSQIPFKNTEDIVETLGPDDSFRELVLEMARGRKHETYVEEMLRGYGIGEAPEAAYNIYNTIKKAISKLDNPEEAKKIFNNLSPIEREVVGRVIGEQYERMSRFYGELQERGELKEFLKEGGTTERNKYRLYEQMRGTMKELYSFYNEQTGFNIDAIAGNVELLQKFAPFLKAARPILLEKPYKFISRYALNAKISILEKKREMLGRMPKPGQTALIFDIETNRHIGRSKDFAAQEITELSWKKVRFLESGDFEIIGEFFGKYEPYKLDIAQAMEAILQSPEALAYLAEKYPVFDPSGNIVLDWEKVTERDLLDVIERYKLKGVNMKPGDAKKVIEDIRAMLKEVEGVDFLGGQNIAKFDIPTIEEYLKAVGLSEEEVDAMLSAAKSKILDLLQIRQAAYSTGKNALAELASRFYKNVQKIFPKEIAEKLQSLLKPKVLTTEAGAKHVAGEDVDATIAAYIATQKELENEIEELSEQVEQIIRAQEEKPTKKRRPRKKKTVETTPEVDVSEERAIDEKLDDVLYMKAPEEPAEEKPRDETIGEPLEAAIAGGGGDEPPEKPPVTALPDDSSQRKPKKFYAPHKKRAVSPPVQAEQYQEPQVVKPQEPEVIDTNRLLPMEFKGSEFAHKYGVNVLQSRQAWQRFVELASKGQINLENMDVIAAFLKDISPGAAYGEFYHGQSGEIGYKMGPGMQSISEARKVNFEGRQLGQISAALDIGLKSFTDASMSGNYSNDPLEFVTEFRQRATNSVKNYINKLLEGIDQSDISEEEKNVQRAVVKGVQDLAEAVVNRMVNQMVGSEEFQDATLRKDIGGWDRVKPTFVSGAKKIQELAERDAAFRQNLAARLGKEALAEADIAKVAQMPQMLIRGTGPDGEPMYYMVGSGDQPRYVALPPRQAGGGQGDDSRDPMGGSFWRNTGIRLMYGLYYGRLMYKEAIGTRLQEAAQYGQFVSDLAPVALASGAAGRYGYAGRVQAYQALMEKGAYETVGGLQDVFGMALFQHPGLARGLNALGMAGAVATSGFIAQGVLGGLAATSGIAALSQLGAALPPIAITAAALIGGTYLANEAINLATGEDYSITERIQFSVAESTKQNVIDRIVQQKMREIGYRETGKARHTGRGYTVFVPPKTEELKKQLAAQVTEEEIEKEATLEEKVSMSLLERDRETLKRYERFATGISAATGYGNIAEIQSTITALARKYYGGYQNVEEKDFRDISDVFTTLIKMGYKPQTVIELGDMAREYGLARTAEEVKRFILDYAQNPFDIETFKRENQGFAIAGGVIGQFLPIPTEGAYWARAMGMQTNVEAQFVAPYLSQAMQVGYRPTDEFMTRLTQNYLALGPSMQYYAPAFSILTGYANMSPELAIERIAGMPQLQPYAGNMLTRALSGDLSAISWASNMSIEAGRASPWAKAHRFYNLSGAPIYQSDFGAFQELVQMQAWSGNQYAKLAVPVLEQFVASMPQQDLDVWMSGGAQAREWANFERNRQFSLQGFALQERGLNLQRKYFRASNRLEDRMRAMQYGFQQADFASRQYSLEMGRRHDIERENLQWERLMLQRGYEQADISRAGRRMELTQQFQLWNLDFQRNRQLLGQQFTREAWQRQDAMAFMQHGWQMEDLNINIARSFGFQRRQLIKEKERQSLMFSMQRQDVEAGRQAQEEMWKLDEEEYNKRKEYLLELMSLDKEEYEQRKKQSEELFNLAVKEFEMQKRQREEIFNFQMKELERQRKEYEQTFKLQNEQISLQRKYQEDQLKLQRDQLNLQKSQADEAYNYQKQLKTISEIYSNMVGHFEQMVRNNPSQILYSMTTLFADLNRLDPAKIIQLRGLIQQIASLQTPK